VEENRNPARSMPSAVGVTLLLVTVIYFFVSLVAVKTLGAEELAASSFSFSRSWCHWNN